LNTKFPDCLIIAFSSNAYPILTPHPNTVRYGQGTATGRRQTLPTVLTPVPAGVRVLVENQGMPPEGDNSIEVFQEQAKREAVSAMGGDVQPAG